LNERAWKPRPGADVPPDTSAYRPGQETIPPEEAQWLFPALGSGRSKYDEHAIFVHWPSRSIHIDWPEHPRGEFSCTTNAQGLRRDTDLSASPVDLRVLITGDSHVDGFCSNAESFAGRLESALAGAHPSRSVEVLNAGKSGYGFYNYVGVCRRWQASKFGVYVVTIYGGNDFVDGLSYRHYFLRETPPRSWEQYRSQMHAPRTRHATAVGQIFNQINYFTQIPEEADLALDWAERCCIEIQRQCAERDAALLFVYLPPASDVQWDKYSVAFAEVQSELGLSNEDVRVTDRMADRLLALLRQRNIAVFDARPLLRAAREPCYWSTDFHLNLFGHALMSEALLPLIESALEPDRGADGTQR
jgi:lysophospholipase L1-like esterase